MNNLLLYCGIVDARISASERDLHLYTELKKAKDTVPLKSMMSLILSQNGHTHFFSD